MIGCWFVGECELGWGLYSVQPVGPVNMFSIIVIFILLNLQCAFANTTTTIVQLRKSVQFSYSGANLFLDLIRGSASPEATEELLEVYLDSKNYDLPSILLTPVGHFVFNYTLLSARYFSISRVTWVVSSSGCCLQFCFP